MESLNLDYDSFASGTKITFGSLNLINTNQLSNLHLTGRVDQKSGGCDPPFPPVHCKTRRSGGWHATALARLMDLYLQDHFVDSDCEADHDNAINFLLRSALAGLYASDIHGPTTMLPKVPHLRNAAASYQPHIVLHPRYGADPVTTIVFFFPGRRFWLM
jgi:hypothetical protein